MRLKTIICSALTIGVAVISTPALYRGYAGIRATAPYGELSDKYRWGMRLTENTEPFEDIRVSYAQRMETDISETEDINLGYGVMYPNTIETFDLSFLEEKEAEQQQQQQQQQQYNPNYYNNNNNNSNNNSNNTPKPSQVSRVPKAPTSTSGAPGGNWCVFQGGNAGIKAFNAGDFPAGTADACQQVYNNVINGQQGQGTFKDEATLNKVIQSFKNNYGVTCGMMSFGTRGCTGYFLGLQSNRLQAASAAERIVQQLFPNGATANDVVQGCARWLCNNTVYNINLASANDIFTRGQGNCNAYAAAMKQMCNAMGVQCELIAGYAFGDGGWGGHAWNQCYVGGAWYHVDVCFADTGANWNYILSATLWSDHSNGVVDNSYMNTY